MGVGREREAGECQRGRERKESRVGERRGVTKRKRDVERERGARVRWIEGHRKRGREKEREVRG